VTAFTADYSNDQVDVVVASNFSVADLYAWWSYNLTTEQGIREFYGGITALDEGNFRIESGTLSLYLDNTTSTNIRQLDNRRLYRADGAYPVLDPTTGGGGIDVVWRNQILISSGSTLTASDIRTELATELARIDVDVSSRSSHATPDLSSLATQASVDALPTLAEMEASNPLTSGTTPADIYAEFTSGSNADAFKADVSSLATQASVDALPTPLTAAEVNAEVDAALSDYDAPTKAELDSAEANIIAGQSGAVPSASDVADAVRTELATELARIDVDVSTRASQGSVDAVSVVVDAARDHSRAANNQTKTP